MFELAPFALPADYAEAILPLSRVKNQCSIEQDETEFDDLLPLLRDAAVDMVERYCGVALAPKTGLVWNAEALPRRLILPVRPVTAITAVEYLDPAGAEQVFAPEGLRIGLRGELLARPGVAWPRIGGGLRVTFDAGFTAADRPAVLVQAAAMFCAHLFLHREAVITGTISGEIPLGFRQLCAPFRPVF